MNLRTRIAAAGTAAAMVSMLGLASTTASAAPSARPTAGPSAQAVARQAAARPRAGTLPVTGMLPDGKKFTGQISKVTASLVKGVPTLSGVLTGTGIPKAGVPFKSAIGSAQAACKVLNLNIQPLNLDLLGLVVNLDAVHLAVNAVPGAGNLLGNLLCALTAGALDPAAPGAAAPGALPTQLIAPILNGVLAALKLAPATPAAPVMPPV